MPPPNSAKAPIMDYDASVPLPDSVVREMSPFHRLMRSHLIGLVLWLSAALVLAVQPLFAVAPVLLLLAWLGVVDVGLMQRFFDYTSGWYIAILMYGLEVLLGFRVRTFGHQDIFKQHSLFIMNHICHFDWMYFWAVVVRHGDITTWKVITKDVVKKVPGAGLSMQYMCNIFISRRWERDEQEFKKKLYYYNTLDLPLQLVLFPEGRDLTVKAKTMSDAYADTNGLERYDYCLHPHARGFLYVMEALRSRRLDAVYDVTIGYPDALAKVEPDFAKGVYMPREIHYYVRHFKAEDLPTNEEELTQWLLDRWREKEKTLELFHAHKRFVEPVAKKSQNGATTEQNSHLEYRHVPEVLRPKSYSFLLCGFAFYGTLLVLFSYFFLVSWVWRWCVAAMIIFTFAKGLGGSGIDAVLPDSIPTRIEDTYKKRFRSKDITNAQT